MNAGTEYDAQPPPRPDPADLGRRIAERRAQLRLSEEALANRAGMAPAYLRNLVQAGPGFDAGGLLRIAAALGVGYRELLEGRADPPPGQGPAAPHPVLVHLSEEECWDRLGGHGVGRVALPAPGGPVVLPVNYLVADRALAYRTDPGGAAEPAAGAAVSFEVDRVDDRLAGGWSVLLTGAAELVDDPGAIRLLDGLQVEFGSPPWVGGNRPRWVRIRPERVTGRRIGTVDVDRPSAQ
ncbi:helix-turn-helix domain-containing protein [Kitasatospora sp. NPDC057015]|uniref:helix-turn-helix domain-containing protein n=1 Tax=Kitasatospora sp. NPDC057015 TaxID=3346001 RepID=UPI0036278A36